MSSVLAAVRPDSWNFPLFVHVLGAMILVGGLLTGSERARVRTRGRALPAARLLDAPAVALPGYIVMRIGAQWIYSK